MLTLVACLPLAALQEAAPPTPYDRVVEVEITADDPALIEGKGPAGAVEHEVEFEGTLHIWTRSELDLYLQVEDANEWRTLGEDDDSGGGTTPYLHFEVQEGDRLLVLVAAADATGTGPLTLHLMAAPETEATRAAAESGRKALQEVGRLVSEGTRAGARERLHETVMELIATPGAANSEAITTTLFDQARFALEELGELDDSQVAWSAARMHRERTLPEDHPDLLFARGNLALTIAQQGDLAGARVLFEAVLATRERTLPEDHPDLLRARGSLAATMSQQGDLAGARALQEAVLAAGERTLPEDHPDLLFARGSLATTIRQQGDLAGARALQEAVLAARERTLPEDHPDLLVARGSLANTIRQQGDLAGARALRETVLAACERTLPEDHPDLLRARGNLANTMWEQGDLAGARALQEAVLAARERTLPEDHPDLLRTRGNLAVTMWQQGDFSGARALVPAQVSGMRALVLGSLAFAPRQAREAVGAEAHHLAQVLLLTRPADADLQGPVFELQETMRLVASEAARALSRAQDPEIRALLVEAGTVRKALNDLIARGSGGRDAQALSAELTRLLQERDQLEREASMLLAERGVVTRPTEVGPLATALGSEGALVTYRRIARWDQDGESGEVVVGREHLLAHVLASDGSLVRLDLGEAAELEELVAAWRATLGAPLLRGVTQAGAAGGEGREQGAGEALRARLLDPILGALGAETRRLFVCADDLVFLVPLDALPFEEGRVGDRWSVANEVSCARLLSPREPVASEPGLLALGGVDYDAGSADGRAVDAAASARRNALPDRFARLLQTRFEAETTGALFEELLEAEPTVLTRKETTKAALFEHAPGKRYVHLATHGWFAPETIKSTLDLEPGERGWARMGLQERVTGMAPMLLCGLALAGANQPRDSLGRRPGVLTAEELCSLDLSQCELAVLSACETNVGTRRAGQGIQSLQAALYAAGARSSITSLWKVDDAATRRLFEIFYTKLWEEKLPKAQALWEAKCVLREEGAPVRDWAGWVLTGDPD